MVRAAILVSGGGTNLQALIDAQSRGELGGGEIVAVISSKEGAYALERAKNAGIPGYVLPRKQFDSNRAMTMALVEMLKGLNIDLVVLAGCMIIFTQELVDAYEAGTLEEVFGTGTAAVISPVGALRFGDRVMQIKDGSIGEYSQKLYDTITGIQLGKIKETKGWVVEVK